METDKGFIGVLRRIGTVVGEEGMGWEEGIGKEKEYIEEKEEVSGLNRGPGEKEDKRWDEEVEKGGWARRGGIGMTKGNSEIGIGLERRTRRRALRV